MSAVELLQQLAQKNEQEKKRLHELLPEREPPKEVVEEEPVEKVLATEPPSSPPGDDPRQDETDGRWEQLTREERGCRVTYGLGGGNRSQAHAHVVVFGSGGAPGTVTPSGSNLPFTIGEALGASIATVCSGSLSYGNATEAYRALSPEEAERRWQEQRDQSVVRQILRSGVNENSRRD